MEYLFLILVILIIVLLLSKKNNIKQPVVKKDEIVLQYKKQMQELVQKYEHDKQKQIQEKIKLLKNINNELSMNIFFDEVESKKILKELSNIG